MKLSVSLPDDDVAALDEYVRATGLPSRSAGLQKVLRRLRYASLEQDYAEAFDEWYASGEAEAWEAVVGDGIGDGTPSPKGEAGPRAAR